MVVKKLAKKAIQDRIKGVKGTKKEVMGPIRAQRKAAQKQAKQEALIKKKRKIGYVVAGRTHTGFGPNPGGAYVHEFKGKKFVLPSDRKAAKVSKQIADGGLIRVRGNIGTPRELSLLKQLENWNPKTPFIKQKTVIKKPVVKRYSRAYPSGIPVQDMYKRSRTVNSNFIYNSEYLFL